MGLTICYWESRSKEGERDEKERPEIHDVGIVKLAGEKQRRYIKGR